MSQINKKSKSTRSQSRPALQDAPLAKPMQKINKGPKLSSKGHNVVIRHRELVADAVSLTTFAPQQVICQPGISVSFPWLATVAQAYEKYAVRKLQYEYVPQCASTSVGSFGMYFDYDPKDGAVTSKTDFSSQDRAVLSQLWQNNVLRVDCDSTQYLVRNGSISGDVVLYDKGSLNYYLQSASTINGFIFVEYEIELIKPQVNTSPPVIAPSVMMARFDLAGSATTTAAATTLYKNSGFILSGKHVQVPTSGDYLVTVTFTGSTAQTAWIPVAFGYTTSRSVAVEDPILRVVLPLTAGTIYQASVNANTTGQLIITAQLLT